MAGKLVHRRPDWVRRFIAAEKARASMPFTWGMHDCCMATVGMIQVMTGVDVAPNLRGYKTKRGAAGMLKRNCPKGFPIHDRLRYVADQIAFDHGLEKVGPKFAQRGDPVLMETATPDGIEWALGIVDLSGSHVIGAAMDGGWLRLPLFESQSLVHNAWRVV